MCVCVCGEKEREREIERRECLFWWCFANIFFLQCDCFDSEGSKSICFFRPLLVWLFFGCSLIKVVDVETVWKGVSSTLSLL